MILLSFMIGTEILIIMGFFIILNRIAFEFGFRVTMS